MSEQEHEYTPFDGNPDSLNYSFNYNPEETKALHDKLNNGKTDITIHDLRRISLWKANRVLSVSQEVLDQLRKLSKTNPLKLSDPIVKETIDMLVKSQGIGFPMASAILKFIRPDVFPIIDVRAYRALKGEKLSQSKYSYELYIEYAKELQELSKCQKINRPLQEIDEQLYCFDKCKDGKKYKVCKECSS